MSLENTTNVDQHEIEKFNSIASTWWDLEGDFKPLHIINPARLAYIQEQTSGLANKSILDIGCGGGILTESMAKLAGDVVGIDMASDSLQVAQLHALETKVTNVRYEQVQAEQYCADNKQQFDVVTCMEMLEHVPDPAAIIEAAAMACKPGGSVFFSTLNKTYKSYALAIVAAEKLLKIVPNGTHDYDKFMKPSQIIRCASNFDLNVKHSIGINYNPIYSSASLTPKLDVNYVLHFKKLV
ncbi:bifunctional 2-polyprenyl-6-hydroxyphenol methylase/3-demethylubiquinol 3-O-methyltransferase UbiG [Psychrosphaera sp. B3R10]|uniref:bifunctional 2-polyprenyl-6-hydroxyphenol methylase/3-demethylubiquinol 3-O-methyltransferase UbiG n=1 Tax=unclassified Psychrosphaera TaxID=2641570 RepID=UPI001C092747|nr:MULTISPECIES: bifunctional 2-polyprenyl-6-hydroxyphenol methylase/3-demethylubiquinol 3-O-methyltransferase UbiG [unclassified Psychrosphaera]MBU2882353.1 bifunctional 2-polyprenyl-6-hydroxyphenol methylase/3-demethylubiquinol 3-O-methyltransferase UbiG [Psychrosphaera sp. I2R16]MBU2989034.1 bifunctional 2-polyprenyl-6-hydroxyphenol methylase/3-demethylubiquinol 3-O-methyltransferase UbiG [Psychrosphaera sp. B3R10]MDO6718030.1 bifunctional 2-polyprenyl-6-hydroxyphenol methylase/3-demethylubiq